MEYVVEHGVEKYRNGNTYQNDEDKHFLILFDIVGHEDPAFKKKIEDGCYRKTDIEYQNVVDKECNCREYERQIDLLCIFAF